MYGRTLNKNVSNLEKENHSFSIIHHLPGSSLTFSFSFSWSPNASPGSLGLSRPRSRMNKHPSKQVPINGTCRIKTAWDAFIYASRSASQSVGGTLDCWGTEYVIWAKYLYPSGKLTLSTAWRTAAETASPHAPPRERKKFRFEITTARFDRVQCACSATRIGWNVKPTPVPTMKSTTAMIPRLVVRVNVMAKPVPLRGRERETKSALHRHAHLHHTYSVQRAKPAQMTSPYRLRRDIYCPEAMDAIDCIETMGNIRMADWMALSWHAFSK